MIIISFTIILSSKVSNKLIERHKLWVNNIFTAVWTYCLMLPKSDQIRSWVVIAWYLWEFLQSFVPKPIELIQKFPTVLKYRLCSPVLCSKQAILEPRPINQTWFTGLYFLTRNNIELNTFLFCGPNSLITRKVLNFEKILEIFNTCEVFGSWVQFWSQIELSHKKSLCTTCIDFRPFHFKHLWYLLLHYIFY